MPPRTVSIDALIMSDDVSFHGDTNVDFDDECSAASFHLFVDHETDKWDSSTSADSLSRYGPLLSPARKDSGTSFCTDSLNMSIHVATMLQESLSDLVHNADTQGALACSSDHLRMEQEAVVERLKQELRELLLSEDLRDHLEGEDIASTIEIASTSDRACAQKQRMILKQKDYLLSMLFSVLSEIEDLEREKRTSGRIKETRIEADSLSMTCRTFSSEGCFLYPSTDLDSISVSSFASSSTSQDFDSFGERERQSREPAALTSEKVRSRRPGSKLWTRIECDLDSALYDPLKCSTSLDVQDRSPKRPQRRGSFD
jgi:hypothetical protein